MANESTDGDVADVGGLVGVLVATGEGEEGSVAMEMKMSRSCKRPKQANEDQKFAKVLIMITKCMRRMRERRSTDAVRCRTTA